MLCKCNRHQRAQVLVVGHGSRGKVCKLRMLTHFMYKHWTKQINLLSHVGPRISICLSYPETTISHSKKKNITTTKRFHFPLTKEKLDSNFQTWNSVFLNIIFKFQTQNPFFNNKRDSNYLILTNYNACLKFQFKWQCIYWKLWTPFVD